MDHILKVFQSLSVYLLLALQCQSEDRLRTASRWRTPATRARGVAGLLRWKKCTFGRFLIHPPPMHSCGIRIEWCNSNCPMNPPVCWHRPKPVFQGLPPSTHSFHVLRSVCTRLPHIHCPIGTNVSLNRQHRQRSSKDQLFQNELRSSVARRPGVHRRFPRRFLHLVEYPCWHSPKATVPSGSRLWDGRRYRPYGVRGDPVDRPTSADKQFLRACPRA